MARSGLRRLITMIAAVAFLAGMQISVMPMAMAATDIAVGVAKSGMPGCGACGQSDQAKAEHCVAMCAAISVVPTDPPASADLARRVDWPWLDAGAARSAATPDSPPPRS